MFGDPRIRPSRPSSIRCRSVVSLRIASPSTHQARKPQFLSKEAATRGRDQKPADGDGFDVSHKGAHPREERFICSCERRSDELLGIRRSASQPRVRGHERSVDGKQRARLRDTSSTSRQERESRKERRRCPLGEMNRAQRSGPHQQSEAAQSNASTRPTSPSLMRSQGAQSESERGV